MSPSPSATPGDPAPPVSADAPPVPAARPLGATGLSAFPIALSGNTFGWTADADDTERILDRFVECGGTLVDTADAYAGGRSEVMIGAWLRSRGLRDRMLVSTKIGKGADHPSLSREAVRGAVHDSLRRLGVERLDVLFLHRDDEEVPLEETLIAVDELRREGIIGEAGFARHRSARLLEARVLAGQLGIAPLALVQAPYSLLQRKRFETSIAPLAEQQGLGVLARFPLASGMLTGKYRSRTDLQRAPRGRDVEAHFGRQSLRVVDVLVRIAEEHDVTAAAVALAWLLTRESRVLPLTSASTADQLDELMVAPGIRLTRHQVADLDRVSHDSVTQLDDPA